MVLLIAGVVLWFAAHGFKRLAPNGAVQWAKKEKLRLQLELRLDWC